MSQYYQKTFYTAKVQADEAAEFYIMQIRSKKTESTGGGALVINYMSACFDASDLDAYLKSNTMPTKTCPYAEFVDMSKEATLRRFLGLAIVNQYSIDVINKLIADGAELNQKDKGRINDSPLMLAAPYPEIVSLLLKAGANVNEQNSFGKTALMYAIQERNVKSISLLLDARVDVNAKTFVDMQCTSLKAGNRTALMYAGWQGNADIIKMIIAAHADLSAKDTNGETALDYLKRNESLSPEEKAELQKLLQTAY